MPLVNSAIVMRVTVIQTSICWGFIAVKFCGLYMVLKRSVYFTVAL